jgi:hypothetical protein
LACVTVVSCNTLIPLQKLLEVNLYRHVPVYAAADFISRVPESIAMCVFSGGFEHSMWILALRTVLL